MFVVYSSLASRQSFCATDTFSFGREIQDVDFENRMWLRQISSILDVKNVHQMENVSLCVQ